MGDVLLVLQAIDLLMSAAMQAGVDFQKFHAARDKARAENRAMTVDELRLLLADSQAAIDAI